VRAGLDVHLIATWQLREALQSAERMKKLKVAVRMIGPAKGKLSRHPELAAAVQAEVEAADIVHIHALWEEIQYQAAVAARRMNKPYIIRAAGMLDRWSLAQNKWMKR